MKWFEPGDRSVATMKEIVLLLAPYRPGLNERAVRGWRERNVGFPDPVGKRRDGSFNPLVWDAMGVLAWALEYLGKPNKGGAPLGNSNAVRHGRYIGERARRASHG